MEMGVALWSGYQAGSIALIAFGLDSGIEIFAGSVLIWRLREEWGKDEDQVAERKATRLLGVTFFLLSVYIAGQASATLLGWVEEPQESPVGILLVVASAVLMTILYRGKSKIARRLGSRALRAEAIESLVCDLQDLTVLVGLGLNLLFQWWWADPVAALMLIPFLLREGIESFRD